MQKITTFLWYDGQAEEAAQLYTSLFKNSKILQSAATRKEHPAKPGYGYDGEFRTSMTRSSLLSTAARNSNSPRRSR